MNHAGKSIGVLAAAWMIAACQSAAVTEPRPSTAFAVDVYDPARAYHGTTLFADTTDPLAPRLVEIDMTGNEVWSYSIVGGVGAGFVRRDAIVHGPMDVERLANGNILFILKQMGVYEITRAGMVVWRHLDPEVSHDADRLANGNTIYVRGWVSRGEDHVREVDRDGRTVWSWNGLPHFDKPEFDPIPGARDGRPGTSGWIHVNGVIRLPNGETAISLRNFEMLGFVDASGAVVRSQRLPTRLDYAARRQVSAPHDPEILPNGNILASLTVHDRVEESADGQRVWLWRHPDGDRRAPVGIRDANRLPNANTLIVSGDHMLEVTPDGTIVWRLRAVDFTLPDVPGGRFPQALFKAQRIGVQ